MPALHIGQRAREENMMTTALRRGESLSVAGADFAPQHREILDALDEVLNVHRDGAVTDRVSTALQHLVTVTQRHFETEDHWLADAAEARYAPHILVHRHILDYMICVHRDLECPDRPCMLPQLRFLDYWLTTHFAQSHYT
jgi:hemerythrin-like metal-binding protein